MRIVRSQMGRRQFLIAAGMTSTSALGLKKLAGAADPVFQTGAAMASEKAGTAEYTGVYSERYSHLLSPIRIGNVVLKNRMTQADSFPRYLMGPETFPSEQIINHYANIAKNGCAVVMCFGGEAVSDRKKLTGEMAHTAMWDREDISVQHYFAQMTDAIHFYGSKAALGLYLTGGQGYSISKVSLRPGLDGKEGEISYDGKEIPVEEIQKIYEDAATQAKFFKSLGFDMANFHMSYQGSIMAHSMSSILNKRTDKYGGSLENRARLPLELFQSVKKACGQDFLVGANISGEDRSGGYTPQDAAEYAKVWEGTLDILVVRGKDQNASHPNGYNLKKNDSQILRYCEIIKKGGAKIAISPNGGFQDLDANEEAIASGKADMITMARAWIADPEYGKKAYEGRGEDVVPCIMCGECHGTNEGPWYSYCSVNPKFGIAHKVNRMIDAPVASRKVAVIGGGPAGMKAAITAAERGHKVTLYEKNDFLGGQLKYTDYVSFKWPYRGFKDYLVRRMYKVGVDVHLSIKATPEMIKTKGYDVVLVATGAAPVVPKIPGADGKNVYNIVGVYTNEESLGKDVALIGDCTGQAGTIQKAIRSAYFMASRI